MKTNFPCPIPYTYSPQPGGRFDATVLEDKRIFAVGGSNGHSEEASCEWYDVDSGKWTLGPSLPIALSNIGKFFFYSSFSKMLFKQKIQYMYLAQTDRCHEIDQEVFLFFVISAVTVNTGQYTG